MAIYHHTTRMIGRSNGGSPVKALAYISGTQVSDERTGETWDFKNKAVEELRILLPDNAPAWAKEVQKLVSEDREKGLQLLSDIANMAEKRGDAQVYREIEFSLPRELTSEQNRQLAGEYVQDQFCGMGMLAIQSFHVEICEKTGELNPHCHTFLLTRELIEDGFSAKKNRDWNERSVHEVWREQWASYASFHLKMHGHDITLDHRSYQDQGLDIEPQVKLGKGVKSQERRAKTKKDNKEKSLDHSTAGNDKSLRPCSPGDSNSKTNPTQGQGFIDLSPATDRVQELRSIQLRNLYRIMRRPETVLDIVTRHHATFMWGDVQKILGRYVDEPELFQRLDARLRNSGELLLLKMEGVRDPSGRIDERAIYTTRSMLKAERALVSTAETLAVNPTHGVSSAALMSGLERIQTTLKKDGYSLSQDQDQAIRHLVDEGQLKCIVGYAGAGKTTALEVASDIWESEGYKVYGLAPTGRAAQNLEQGGISSMTLHKFLKSFEEGRSQFGEKSVLVLDEAGMVDVERFDRFLGAVKALGVKAVVVGDGAQLQPVEAGPAFRLVTQRVGLSRLEKVVRQKEEWQREATVLFGKQESKAAIQVYQKKGNVHLVEEPLKGEPLKGPLSKQNLNKGTISERIPYQGKTVEDAIIKGILRQYEVSTRTSGLIFREIMKEIKAQGNDSHKINQHQGGSRLGVDQYEESNHPKGVSQLQSTHQTQASNQASRDVNQHQDYPQFLKFKEIQKEAARKILGNSDDYKGVMEARGLDPLEMARLFVDKKQDKASQYKQAAELLKTKKLDHLIGIERAPGHSVEVRSAAKVALIEDWKQAYHDNPTKTILDGTLVEGSPLRGSLLMMAYSNKDVRDLNTQARIYLKGSGTLGREDMTYTITREVEDDFGRRTKVREKREFSKGDRIVFTRNKGDLGVKNGTMGTILSLDKNSIEVALDKGALDKGSSDKGKTLTFSPNMFSFFDQGWAVTIHKAQGTTVDKSFLLASHEMNQNLTYVAMTRHREDVHVYGSTLDFWRPEKVSEVLSKSGEKLGAADYLDAQSLSLLMKDEDKFLDRLFTRLGDELQAMGAVSKRAFGIVADYFLGRSSDGQDPSGRPILLKPETLIKGTLVKGALIKGTIREEDRAHEILQKTPEQIEKKPDRQVPLDELPSLQGPLEDPLDILNQYRSRINHTLQNVYEDWKHPAFKNAGHYKKVFEEGLKLHGDPASGDHTHVDHTSVVAAAIDYWNIRRGPFLELYGRKLEAVAEELASPLLSYMSEESRKLAHVCALQDPDRALEFLSAVKSSKQAEQNAREKNVFPQDNTLEKDSKKAAEKNSSPLSQKSEEKATFLGGSEVFEELTKKCAQKLYAYLGEKKLDLTPERITRVERQAEKASNFIFHAHTLKGTSPTIKETEHFLLRAKYELDRIPEIRDELTHKWQEAGSYKREKDELIAHIIAERQASIEGRMHLIAKQNGFKAASNLPDLAEKELKINRALTERLAHELIKKHGLSEKTATSCAKDILRYQETHGEKPSSGQMSAMVQISRELDKDGYPASMGSHNIEYLRRRDWDHQFRELSSAGKDLSGFSNFPHDSQTYREIETCVKSYGAESYKETTPARAVEENEKVYSMEMSL